MTDESQHLFRRALAMLAVVLVFTMIVTAATTTYPVGEGSHWQTDSDLTVGFAYDYEQESGNPFSDADTATLDGITFEGQNADVTVSANDSQWTNITNINIESGGRVRVDPHGRTGVGATETVDSLNISDVDPDAENDTEFIYSADGDATIYLNNTGLSEGSGVVAVDPDTGEPLDAESVQSDGSVVFDELPDGTHAVDIRQGPAELKVFQETNPSELVQSDAGLTFRFFSGTDSETVVEKEVTDGTVDLTGIPPAARVVITVDDESGNYAYRRITLNSLTQQEDIYLLNTSKQSVTASQINFRLDDQTGQFGTRDTVIRVRKPVRKDFDGDGTNETEYRTITGGNFGSANNFRSNLLPNTRYRLIVTNAQGNERVLGTYTPPEGDEVEVLPIGTVTIDADNDGAIYYSEAEIENTSSGPIIRVKYVDEAEKTESINYKIYNTTNESVIASGSGTGTYGIFQATHGVSAVDTRYRIEITGERGTEQFSQNVTAGDIPPVLKAIPIDSRWLELLGYISIVAFAGFGVIIDTRLGAGVAVAFATILTALGVVTIPFALLSAAAGVAVMFLASTDGSGPP